MYFQYKVNNGLFLSLGHAKELVNTMQHCTQYCIQRLKALTYSGTLPKIMQLLQLVYHSLKLFRAILQK